MARKKPESAVQRFESYTKEFFDEAVLESDENYYVPFAKGFAFLQFVDKAFGGLGLTLGSYYLAGEDYNKYADRLSEVMERDPDEAEEYQELSYAFYFHFFPKTPVGNLDLQELLTQYDEDSPEGAYLRSMLRHGRLNISKLLFDVNNLVGMEPTPELDREREQLRAELWKAIGGLIGKFETDERVAFIAEHFSKSVEAPSLNGDNGDEDVLG